MESEQRKPHNSPAPGEEHPGRWLRGGRADAVTDFGSFAFAVCKDQQRELHKCWDQAQEWEGREELTLLLGSCLGNTERDSKAVLESLKEAGCGGRSEPRTWRGEGNQCNYLTSYPLNQRKRGLQALMQKRSSADTRGPEKSIILWQCCWRKEFAS